MPRPVATVVRAARLVALVWVCTLLSACSWTQNLISSEKIDYSALRAIGDVADTLGLPAHVLRFWETKFPQVRPLKRGGGRRYYRPEDVDLLRRIQRLLYGEGYTIKGVQRLLRDPHGTASPADDQDEGPEAEGEDALGPLSANAAADEGSEHEDHLSPEQRNELEGILTELEELRELLHGSVDH